MINKIVSARHLCMKLLAAQSANEESQKNVHVIKNGESLWSIAQAELGKDAKNNEIYDYMLNIAKVNGLNTKKIK